jgi:hypothetical protein
MWSPAPSANHTFGRAIEKPKERSREMNNWYIGYSESKRTWEVFSCDNPKQATIEASGYEKVEGPFLTEEEANETADANN